MPSTKHAGHNRRPHRSAEQWRAIVDRYESSDLSQADFCRRERVSLTSFCRWRRRFLAEDDQAGFVELVPASPPATASAGDWTLEIDLPGGGSLRLRGGR
jgi:hypothetical protein